MIDLRYGEMPVAFEPAVQRIKKEANNINKYPDENYTQLIHTFAQKEQIKKENILITNGSMSSFNMILSALYQKNASMLIPSPTFFGFEQSAKHLGYKIQTLLLDQKFWLTINAIKEKILPQTTLIVLANPNNPTWNMLVNNDQIQELLEEMNAYIIIDESYFAISQESCVPLIKQYDNLIVLRGFSKWYGLAWLRIGAILANPLLIQRLANDASSLNKFPVNSIAVHAAQEVLQQQKEMDQYIATFSALKTDFEKQLWQIPEVQILATKTTFSLIYTPLCNSELCKKLETHGVLIKKTSIYPNLEKNMSVISVPSRNDMSHVIKAFVTVLWQ